MDLTGKYVYLSGPMTGIENWNYEQFKDASEKLLSDGAAFVFNPAVRGVKDPKPHEYYMLVDLHELTQSYDGKPIYDVIAMLPGWGNSQGAKLERDVAIAIGLEVMYL